SICFFFLVRRVLSVPTLFPYTTLFRSLEVFGVSCDERIWHAWQTAPGAGWNGTWAELYSPADRLHNLVVGRNQDGRLEVFGTSSDRKSTRLNSSHQIISYAVFCLKKKN